MSICLAKHLEQLALETIRILKSTSNDFIFLHQVFQCHLSIFLHFPFIYFLLLLLSFILCVSFIFSFDCHPFFVCESSHFTVTYSFICSYSLQILLSSSHTLSLVSGGKVEFQVTELKSFPQVSLPPGQTEYFSEDPSLSWIVSQSLSKL